MVANDVTQAPANTTSIQAALTSCDASHFVVNIPAGTYYVAGWSNQHSEEVVRGAGPNATYIYNTVAVGCGVFGSVCLGVTAFNLSFPQFLPGGTNVCQWIGTNGVSGTYTQGATSLLLNACGSGISSLLTGASQIWIDQINDITDTGGQFVCDSATGNTFPCTTEGIDTVNGRCYSQVTTGQNCITSQMPANGQEQIATPLTLTNNGNGTYTLTTKEGNYFNNIRTSQNPGIFWWDSPLMKHAGLENLTIDEGLYMIYVASSTGFTVGRYVSGATSGATGYIAAVTAGVISVVQVQKPNGDFMYGETINETLTRGGPPDGTSTTMSANSNYYVANPVAIVNCYQCWVKNTRLIDGGRASIWLLYSSEAVIRDNYLYGAKQVSSGSYGIELEGTSKMLVENNIFQQSTASIIFGQGTGCVVDYNYLIGDIFGIAPYFQFMQAGFYASHASSNNMNLWEGNSGNEIHADPIHGTSYSNTYFRNNLAGWEMKKAYSMFPIIIDTYNRNFNIVGNIVGQAGWANTYESYSTTAMCNPGDGCPMANSETSIYIFGTTYGGSTRCQGSNFQPGCDVLVRPSTMRWGNWDPVTQGTSTDSNAGTRWDTTEASPTARAYVNANFTTSYFASLAHTLPASLYYSSKPSWWPAGKNWPPIGPDVTTGNVAGCLGGTYTGGIYAAQADGSFIWMPDSTKIGAQAISNAQCTGGALSTTVSGTWGHHATSIPAQDCYLNTMGGPPDGSGNVLSFDANVCYYGAVSTVVATPVDSPGMGTYTAAQTITLTDATSGAAICYTVNGTTPTATTAGTCDSLTGEMTYSTPFSSPSSTFTLKAIGTKSGLTNSGLLTSVYTISSGPPPTTGYSGTLSGSFH